MAEAVSDVTATAVAENPHRCSKAAMRSNQVFTLILDHEEQRSLSGKVAGPRADGVDVVVRIAQLLRMRMRMRARAGVVYIRACSSHGSSVTVQKAHLRHHQSSDASHLRPPQYRL